MKPKQTQCSQYRNKPTLKLNNGILTYSEQNLCNRVNTFLLSSNGIPQPFELYKSQLQSAQVMQLLSYSDEVHTKKWK